MVFNSDLLLEQKFSVFITETGSPAFLSKNLPILPYRVTISNCSVSLRQFDQSRKSFRRLKRTTATVTRGP